MTQWEFVLKVIVYIMIWKGFNNEKGDHTFINSNSDNGRLAT